MPLLLWLELCVVLVFLAFALLLPARPWTWSERAERSFRQFAERRVASILLVGLLAIGARLAVLPWLPVPQPTVNDEFSFLLAGDTFAHRRVANPPHPMWVHFENLHVLQQPTYASMYPPAQGIFLAIGERFAGIPFAGLCLVVALFCAASCWALQGWTSPPLALLGGLLAVIRFGIFSYWANSYWAGATAALGGAVVIGALPRIRKSKKTTSAILLGCGLALLANSRPFEGMVFSLPVGFWFARWLWRQKNQGSLREAAVRVALPLAVVLLIAAAATGYYFWRVTGNPLLMPQMLDRKTYAVAPYFLWQSPRPEPAYNHPFLRSFYVGTELDFYRSTRHPVAAAALLVVKLYDVWLFYLGPALTVPLLVAWLVRRRSRDLEGETEDTRFLWAVVVCTLAGLALEVFFLPHYVSPIACVLLALVVRAVGELRRWQRRGKPSGMFLSRAIPGACLILLALRCAAGPMHWTPASDWPPTSYNTKPASSRRAEILGELRNYPGKHLILVSYGRKSLSRNQWVYNDADVDASHVVWAWDMGDARNRELLEYFKDRRIWHVDPDHEGAELSPY